MRSLFLLTMLLLISACSMRQPTEADWAAGREVLAVSEDWGFKGRMAVKIEDAATADRQSGGQVAVNWQQNSETSRIRLSGPLGAGAWELVWGPDQVTASDADGERTIRYTGPAAAENFMRDELGWVFPADSIRYWVRGLSAPATDVTEVKDENGRLSVIRQQDWEVSYDRYKRFDALMLPAKITITGRGVRMRLVISRWQIETPTG